MSLQQGGASTSSLPIAHANLQGSAIPQKLVPKSKDATVRGLSS